MVLEHRSFHSMDGQNQFLNVLGPYSTDLISEVNVGKQNELCDYG
jgi:hypothetical protein